MLENTIIKLISCGIYNIDILTNDNICIINKIKNLLMKKYNLQLNIIIDDNELNKAIMNYLKKKNKNIMILMSDLPLLNKKLINKIISECNDDFLIVPSHGDGTNILFIKDASSFKVKYYGNSFLKHIDEAKKNNLKIKIFDSYILSIDFDNYEDIIKIITYGKGKVKSFIKKYFTIDDNYQLIRIK